MNGHDRSSDTYHRPSLFATLAPSLVLAATFWGTVSHAKGLGRGRLKVPRMPPVSEVRSAAEEALDKVRSGAERLGAEAAQALEDAKRFVKDPTRALRDEITRVKEQTATLRERVGALEGELARVQTVQGPDFVAAQVRQLRDGAVSLRDIPTVAPLRIAALSDAFPRNLVDAVTDTRSVVASDIKHFGKSAAAFAAHTDRAVFAQVTTTFEREWNHLWSEANEFRDDLPGRALRELSNAQDGFEMLGRDPSAVGKAALRTYLTLGNNTFMSGYYDKAGRWVKATESELTEETRAGFRTIVTVGNTPILTGYYDKSGRWVKQNEKMLITIAVVAALSATPGGQTLAGQMLIAAAQAYYTSEGDPKQALIAAATAGAFYGVGSAIPLEGQTGANLVAAKAGKVVLHGMVGAASATASGRDPKDGFLAAAISQTVSVSGGYDLVGDNAAAQGLAAAAVGGTTAEATGGKFEDGATMALVSHMANDMAHRTETAITAANQKHAGVSVAAGAGAAVAAVAAASPEVIDALLLEVGKFLGTLSDGMLAMDAAMATAGRLAFGTVALGYSETANTCASMDEMSQNPACAALMTESPDSLDGIVRQEGGRQGAVRNPPAGSLPNAIDPESGIDYSQVPRKERTDAANAGNKYARGEDLRREIQSGGNGAKGAAAEKAVIEALGADAIKAGEQLYNDQGRNIGDIDVETTTELIEVKSGENLSDSRQAKVQATTATARGKKPVVMYDPQKVDAATLKGFREHFPMTELRPKPQHMKW